MQRCVMVTGAAGGIGRACAHQILAEGAALVAVDRTTTTLQASPTCALVDADIARPEDCARAVAIAVERFGRLDALIHCAAIHSSHAWDALTADVLNQVLAVNVTGSFLIAQAAARQMVGQGGGAIVLTSSSNVITGGIGGQAGQGGPAYVASKAALTGLVRSLARALGPHDIRVNAVAPGVTDTPMIQGYAPETRAAQAARHALGRIAVPEDIAGVLCFLTTDAARFMTGEVVVVNGGANFG